MINRSIHRSINRFLHDSSRIQTALTYDDVLLVPTFSDVTSRKSVSLRTQLSTNIWLNNPIVSSNMDTVTEDRMSIEMAKNGGIGILHRFSSVAEQVEQVRRVKRAEAFIIADPYRIPENETAVKLVERTRELGVRSMLVTDSTGHLSGIVTSRDLRFANITPSTRVSELMTPRSKLRVAFVKSKDQVLSREEVRTMLQENRLEKLPIVDKEWNIFGLITSRDFYHALSNPHASHDRLQRLIVGAAIGVKAGDLDRALALCDAGVDCLVVDVAHGHSLLAMQQVKELKRVLSGRSVDIIAGNVCTGKGAVDLIDCGADAVKVGVGPGSICTTRIVTGCGVPQLSALFEVASTLRDSKLKVPIIADGGVKTSGDITKALAAGAQTVMLGNLLAGTDESPGLIITKNGRKIKLIRGMAGISANLSNRERQSMKKDDIFDVVPEGVEAQVAYRGSVKDIVKQLCGGLASGISYCGAHDIPGMQKNAKFIRITGSGIRESNAHDVTLE